MSGQCSTCETLKVVLARLNLLERKLNEVLHRQGITDPELTDFELDEAIDIGVTTGDYTAIKETLRKRIEQEGRLKKADAGDGSTSSPRAGRAA